ncbi:type II toxin-antitoxin system RelB/DinJ family antitoxin [Patescibacteria group bacterium]
MATIQLRIDNTTKKSAKSILDKLGIDMTSAIKIYLKQIVINKGIPFKLLTENGLTIEQENEILKAAKEAEKGKNMTDAMDADKAIEHLKKR